MLGGRGGGEVSRAQAKAQADVVLSRRMLGYGVRTDGGAAVSATSRVALTRALLAPAAGGRYHDSLLAPKPGIGA